MNKLDYFTVAGGITGFWKSRDVLISYGDAFGEFVDRYLAATGRRLSNQIHNQSETLTRRNSFSICAANTEGKVIALAAARIDDLGDEALCDYWRRHFPRVYATEGHAVVLNPLQPSLLDHVSGRVAYLSDLWVSREHRQNSIGRDFTVLAQIICQLFFDTDYVYFFVSKEIYERGDYFKHAGMSLHVECGTLYDVPPVDVNANDVLLLNDKRGIEHMVRLRAAKSSLVVERK